MGRKKCASQIYMPTHFVLVRASERERKRKRKRKRERERDYGIKICPAFVLPCTSVHLFLGAFNIFSLLPIKKTCICTA